jgi:hypothetical protein
MMKTAMREDFSWKNSAEEYLKLYNKLANSETTADDLVNQEREAEAQIACAQQAATKIKTRQKTQKRQIRKK